MKKRSKSRLKLTKRLRIPKSEQEDYLHEQGFEFVCGVDEVGRGAWAGPLVASAVILSRKLYGLRDSKLLTAKERVNLAQKIKKSSIWGIGEVGVEELDKLKLTKATQMAFARAIKDLHHKIDYVLADGFPFDSPLPCRAIKKGDMTCSSIAAASIIAKVYRDKLMKQMDRKINGYYFCKHKGYGTKLHQKQLAKHGPSALHRKTFMPIKKLT